MDAKASQLASHDTSTVSDALDRLGIAGQCLGIKPLDRSFRLAGRAFTVRMVPVGQSAGSVGDYIDDVAPGEIVVLDNDGRLDTTIWGDLATCVAHVRGVGGTVIDGVCRDLARSLEFAYPVFARGNAMRTGKDRVTADALGVTVQIAGVRVDPGDLLLGDADGVVVVPRQREDEVLGAAAEIAAVEAQILEAVGGGMRLDEARRRHGYHRLQSRTGDIG